MSVTPNQLAVASGPPRWRTLASALGPLWALLAVVLVFVIADWLKPGANTFLSMRVAGLVAAQSATVAVAALGMTVIIIAGGIDLSAGTTTALCATAVAWCLREDYGVAVALPAGIAAGVICGALNGFLISALRVVPFIVTLGSMTIFLGVAKLLADETTVRPALQTQVPRWLQDLVTTRPTPKWLLGPFDEAGAWGVPNFANGVWLTLVLALLLGVVLKYTVFGRHVFALGSNEDTARLCGLRVSALKVAVYALGGLFVGIAGIYQFALLSTGEPTAGTGLELKIIAAVVIGGGSLSGGRGAVLGTLAGALMMGVIKAGCTLLELSNPMEDIIVGLMIVVAVTLDMLRQRRLEG